MKDWIPDRAVLLAIVIGLIAILLAIVIGIFDAAPQRAGAIPTWAENVLVAISTGALLKIGDAIGALVTLAGGRTTEKLGQQLATSTPGKAVPQEAADAADQVADAAQDQADAITGAVPTAPPTGPQL